ncbi:MAG: methyltransferase [Ruminococcus sp.]|nr:methyltransferase [Ruminococcus sp.]
MSESRLEPLGGGMHVWVSDAHHFSTDTILLAHFSQPKGRKQCVDLGTGCGTIPLLWLRENKELRVTAVELQEEACALTQKSIAHNQIGDKLTVLNADLRDLKDKLPLGCFDVVACNPPYKLGGSGIENPDSAKLLARHEAACTLQDICRTASGLLQFGGRFCVCQRSERLADVMEAMREFAIEPKTLRLVQQRQTKAPKLFLLEGRKGGKRGFLNVLPTLLIEDESGGFSAEMMAIYGDYKNNNH